MVYSGYESRANGNFKCVESKRHIQRWQGTDISSIESAGAGPSGAGGAPCSAHDVIIS